MCSDTHPPRFLSRVYENLVRGTRRYVLIAEYYNPTPVALDYRGHRENYSKEILPVN